MDSLLVSVCFSDASLSSPANDKMSHKARAHSTWMKSTIQSLKYAVKNYAVVKNINTMCHPILINK